MKKCIIDNLFVIANHTIFGEYFNEIGATTVFDYFAQIICRKVTDYSDSTNLKRTFLMNIFVIISFNIRGKSNWVNLVINARFSANQKILPCSIFRATLYLTIWQLCCHWWIAIIWSINPLSSTWLQQVKVFRKVLVKKWSKQNIVKVLASASGNGNKKHLTLLSISFPIIDARKGNWGNNLCVAARVQSSRWQTQCWKELIKDWNMHLTKHWRAPF